MQLPAPHIHCPGVTVVRLNRHCHEPDAARDERSARLEKSIARADHSTLLAEELSKETLSKQSEDYRPTLKALGAIERDLLDRFDGTHSAAELESWLVARAGPVLASPREAAAFLKQTIERFG